MDKTYFLDNEIRSYAYPASDGDTITIEGCIHLRVDAVTGCHHIRMACGVKAILQPHFNAILIGDEWDTVD